MQDGYRSRQLPSMSVLCLTPHAVERIGNAPLFRHGRPEMTLTSTLPGLAEELAAIKGASLWKTERQITGAQGAHIRSDGTRNLLNFCANNYLGLANHPRLIEAAKAALDSHGLGMASVRFICGTNDLHAQLEARIAAYVGMEDSILFAACFDANGGVFEPLFGDKDAIISDSLNHASIIDGIRLSKAARFRYANGDMNDLELQLKAAREKGARRVVIVTDGVFSMDGYFADLVSIRKLASKYDALIMVDDCHATGFIGPKGSGTPARAGVKVDILTGTLGKALGGSMGGYIAASKNIVDLMRQRARPYLFSNALPPAITAAGIAAIDIAENGDKLREKLFANANRFRTRMETAGFNLLPGEHPIIPVMLGEAKLAQDMANRLQELGIYVTGFFFPVVPQGKARIRTQMSAAHSADDIDAAVAAFIKAGSEMGVI
jgi:glycine C-acetyltransferase